MILPQIILTPDFYAYKTQATAISHSSSLLKNKTVFLHQALSLNTVTLHSLNVLSFRKCPPIPIFQNIPSPESVPLLHIVVYLHRNVPHTLRFNCKLIAGSRILLSNLQCMFTHGKCSKNVCLNESRCHHP